MGGNPSPARVVFRLPNNAEFILHRDDSWTFGDGVSIEIRELLSDVKPSLYVVPHVADYSEYIEVVAKATESQVVYREPPSQPPPADAVF